MTDTWLPGIASFIVQALDLEMDPAELIQEIVALKRGEGTGTSAIELQSSAGLTPFLVYHYDLTDGDRSRFDADVATLERAAKLDAPGPRIVASATTDAGAFILATTPAVFEALTGIQRATPRRPPMPIERARGRVPDRLVEKLREANRLAGDWLSAIRAAGERGDDLSLTNQEAALALFLLDERSIRDLLQALTVLLASARGGVAADAN